ncbi:diadenylate cyclase CdaA [Aneurinibacillus aneurinilyticus]|jgi:diadenylate cyclase|uniref:Diadenylate cyclase n=2 Tax=Aneurinibacillus aneurinilyticus TaxID=1391 RepID=A0A848D687_ANEAE|nr:diadenylate cyclase CdaA [Aneurinibacillus aneurinilyticus]ERI06820.1 TIGR00159 family protein [Aneurinibacillus aneurinilyticus ATCC 12856]MCI1696769.1 diadenylate cyclase CdaA [Aneurinibacillus aneurinilyticus]MED0673824.1 diadenylate cyclase CdaA [Aneurinibacillus aneurinilyticus]MED0709462.1 diadenylate cyclase CdaA [Aneurinibacillus aneurinilyticus]MED0726125.1 diadenylate cyclase CdaA [Aneurinibacillus aneurinilyticus]
MEDFTENFLGYIINAVDILIVTYIIYKLILLLRGTRALQLFKGIIVIVVVMLASTVLQLRTLQWLMDKAFTYGVFAILVIFQPELRRALEQIGRGRLFSRSSAPEEKAVADAVEAIVKSVFYMAKRRIGALIVIERETGLSDYIETGINLTARSSTELLINIFIPNTPLHDGAVIMRKDMVMAAGCYLPLSENPTISKELGTRHRAAIGLSEVSDALAVVVSEETGQVSIALNGEISRDYDQEKLTELLYEKLTQQGRATAPIWQRKVKNDG